MNPWALLAMVWALAAAVMVLGWGWQRRHANASIVDVLWAASVGAAAVLLGIFGQGAAGVRGLLAVLGGGWGLRLALHLWRRVRAEPEDGRYRHLRTHWNGHQGKFFLFFQAQALLVVLFALPFVAVSAAPRLLAWWAAVAVVVWLVSVGGEAIADRQLARHRADPAMRGKTCRSGLWRYSRHPNYFFEWTHWFAYVALAVGSPLAGWAWLGPVVMLAFLRWVSGIPYTEAQALRTRGEDYRQYQQTTSMLFPWFPRHASSTPRNAR